MGRTSDAREKIIEHALELVHAEGYEAVGIAEICKSAEVNKGSFYHFFKSKQALGLAIVDEYWSRAKPLYDAVRDDQIASAQRLKRFTQSMKGSHKQALEERGCVRGCMIGNLSLELSTRDDLVRARLDEILDQQRAALAALIKDLQADGLADASASPAALARDVIAFAQGAVMMAKVQNSDAPLRQIHSSLLRLLGG